MCDICRQSPCNPRCPNAPDPPAVYTCQRCNEPIIVGEDYFELNGEYWHDECARDNAMSILTEKCGGRMGIAEEEDYGCY